MSAATYGPHGYLHHPAPLTPILLQRLRDQELGSQDGLPADHDQQLEQSQGTLVDCSNQGHWDPSRISSGSYKQPPVRPETTAPLDHSLCAEASKHFDDIGPLARAQVHPSAALQIRSMEPRCIHALVQQHAHALMVYHAALELHRTTSRVLTDMRSQRDAVFGPGVWITGNIQLLDVDQRAAAEDVMRNWDQEYAENWPAIVESLTVLEPR
ncbi:hypothetical protein BKA70DRAFT_795941 [Coprinopsis sp. MPI-PUGE-AT-0042]|nr:hypothetical protein BKA70DRAFT_795941 [Coprinopsis sp. MPI-PUGE-AT-0042]